LRTPADGKHGVLARMANTQKGRQTTQGELEGSSSASPGPYLILSNINDAANRAEILRVDHRADVYRNG
jgi:hypothetical protein